AAPSSLVGGAALQREDEGLHRKVARLIRAEDSEKFEKPKFRELLRAEMPEVSNEFLDKFSDLADSYHMKLRKSELRKDDRSGDPTPLSPEEDGPVQVQDVKLPPVPARVEAGRPKRWGEVPRPNLGERKKLSMDERGNLTLPNGTSLEFHV